MLTLSVDRVKVDPATLSVNPDAFRIASSTIPGAGLSCYATRDLPASTNVLDIHRSPIAYVICQPFRKEVCAWCFSYNRGNILKHKLETGGRNSRGVAWFCQTSCIAAWRNEVTEGGVMAVIAVEEALTRLHLAAPADADAPCTANDIDSVWEEALKISEKLLGNRKRKPQARSVLRPACFDIDDCRFILSGLISLHHNKEAISEVLQLGPSWSPYLASRSKLAQHIDILHFLTSALPLDSPVLAYVTPYCITALITRDSGNSFGIWDLQLAGQELFGYAMYPFASYFNHSCSPNLQKRRTGRFHEFITCREVVEGEELCISYLGGAERELDKPSRQKRLRDGWFFGCSCSRCRERET
jgi:SET domain